MLRSDYVDEGRSLDANASRNAGSRAPRILYPHSVQPYCACDRGEIGIMQGDIGAWITGRFHFHFHEAKSAVVDNTIFTGSLSCTAVSNSPEASRGAVSRERNNLATRECRLCSERLGHGICHRAMIEGPSRRLRPFMRRYRAAQMTGVPVSAVKIASSVAILSSVAATYCGWRG